MEQDVTIEEFLSLQRETDLRIFDVRSPGEFNHGHLPGAVSLPLFSDEERAEIGTIYAQKGRQAGIQRGIEVVGPKMAEMVAQAWRLAPQGRAGVYCWRGGMRSSSVSWLLSTAGFSQAVRLNGGYKAFRRLVREDFRWPWRFQVLGGMTGSGKTEVLRILSGLGEQVVDLEGIANHRGSSFGHIGMGSQPSTEDFENQLWKVLSHFDAQRRIWIEDESLSIGSVHIPREVFDRMQLSPMVVLRMDAGLRAARLTREYSGCGSEPLELGIERIRRRLGGVNTRKALEAVRESRYPEAAEIILHYYDKAYSNCMARPRGGRVVELCCNSADPQALARRLMQEE